VLSSGAKPNLVADDQVVPEDALVLVATSGDLHIVTDRLRPRPQTESSCRSPASPAPCRATPACVGKPLCSRPRTHRTATSGARSDTGGGPRTQGRSAGAGTARIPPTTAAGPGGRRRAPLSCPFCSRRHRRAVREELRRAHGQCAQSRCLGGTRSHQASRLPGSGWRHAQGLDVDPQAGRLQRSSHRRARTARS
jgi:hypothetical protein